MKELKFYEAPVMESIELELEGHLLDGSLPTGTTIETDPDDWAED